MFKTHRIPALAAGMLSLVLPLAALASDPPSISENQSACAGKYSAKLKLVFDHSGSAASAHAEASLVRNPFAQGSVPYPNYFVAQSVVMSRNSANPNWVSDVQDTEITGAYSTTPVTSGTTVFKAPGCELVAAATVNVQCPNGTWEYKNLERRWPGCGQ